MPSLRYCRGASRHASHCVTKPAHAVPVFLLLVKLSCSCFINCTLRDLPTSKRLLCPQLGAVELLDEEMVRAVNKYADMDLPESPCLLFKFSGEYVEDWCSWVVRVSMSN